MKAYELIAKPENWTQMTVARNINLQPVEAGAFDAVCWCLFGAIERCYGYSSASVLQAVGTILGKITMGKWNDDPARTHAEVIALLKQVEG